MLMLMHFLNDVVAFLFIAGPAFGIGYGIGKVGFNNIWD